MTMDHARTTAKILINEIWPREKKLWRALKDRGAAGCDGMILMPPRLLCVIVDLEIGGAMDRHTTRRLLDRLYATALKQGGFQRESPP
jgi:hypothetical protein